MNQPKSRGISRRQFAGRAALLSATATIAPAATALAGVIKETGAGQAADTHPHLSPESQTEAEARYQQILAQYGTRLSSEEKSTIQRINLDLQGSLDRVRAFPLENGNAPALYLKPLVEREKKPAEKPANAAAKNS